MTNLSSPRIVAIVTRPADLTLAANGVLQRYATEGVDITVILAAHGSTRDNTLQRVRELVILNSVDEDPQRSLCELVSHLRRVRPEMVLTLSPDRTSPSIGQLATTAVLLAADVRFGHSCTSRRPHTVSKLYYLAPETGSFVAALNTLQPGSPDDGDLLAGVRQPADILSRSA